jgi:peptidoglycan hydrolase CwlO-like protein
MAMAATLLFATLITAPAGASTKTDLANAKAKLDKLINQIATEREAIQGLEANIEIKVAALDAVQGKLDQTQAAIVRLESDINTATLELLSIQRQLDRRAAVAYENGPGSTFEFLLGSTSLTDFSDRLEIVDHAAQSDQTLINEMRDQRAALQAKQIRKEELKKELRGEEDQLQKQKAELQAQLDVAQKAADQLSSDKAEADRQVTKLEKQLKKEKAAAAEAARERARLAAASGGSTGGSTDGAVGHPFSACPVDQPRAYSDSFGAPRYGGGFHPHAGNDIFAPRYTAIRAPFSGTASAASNGLGGIAVNVSGPDGFVYNAHLQQIVRLGPVNAGDVVGLVGDTGDAQGGATHDHFEWHPYQIPAHPHVSPYGYSVINGAIDPYPYLNQVC